MSTVLGQIQYGTDVRIAIDKAQLNCYSISLPLIGQQELCLPGGLIQSDVNHGVIISPQARQELTIAGDCCKLQVAIRSNVMHNVLEELLTHPAQGPLVFEPRMPLSDGALGGWWRMVRFLVEETSQSHSFFQDGSITRDMERALIKGLILSQPNNYSAELFASSEAEYPHYLRRACQFIRENAGEELRLLDLERASGVSHSTLYDAFRRHCGMSPTHYLKRYRLQAVRQALLDGPVKQNISAVAMGWGFNHMGRFSSDYRKAYAETPSDTLERRG
jgi:AraC-like DNA-binding protein